MIGSGFYLKIHGAATEFGNGCRFHGAVRKNAIYDNRTRT